MKKQKLYKIPRIIHFIWAGGSLMMPKREINTVVEWAMRNKDWKIYLWVDSKTFPGNIVTEYQKTFTRSGQMRNVTIEVIKKNFLQTEKKKIESIFIESENFRSNNNNNNTSLRIFIKDIREEQYLNAQKKQETICEKNIEYEIERLKPNFGASSDLLRYRILYAYGGAYFDTDVAPGEDNLDTIFTSSSPSCYFDKHILYVEAYSQSSTIPSQKLAQLKPPLDEVGNDALIATQFNPILKEIYKSCTTFYNQLNKDDKFRIMKAHGSLRLTIYFTGPERIREVLKKNQSPNLKLNYLRTQKIKLTKPLKNTTHWLKTKDIMLESKQCTKIVKKSMSFEIEHFGICCLDEYIESLKTVYHDKDDNYLFNLIEDFLKENLPHIKFLQLTGANRVTMDFCQKFKVRNIFELQGDLLKFALIRHAELEEFEGFWESNKNIISQNLNRYYNHKITSGKILNIILDKLINCFDKLKLLFHASEKHVNQENFRKIIYELVQRLFNYYEQLKLPEKKLIIEEKNILEQATFEATNAEKIKIVYNLDDLPEIQPFPEELTELSSSSAIKNKNTLDKELEHKAEGNYQNIQINQEETKDLPDVESLPAHILGQSSNFISENLIEENNKKEELIKEEFEETFEEMLVISKADIYFFLETHKKYDTQSNALENATQMIKDLSHGCNLS